MTDRPYEGLTGKQLREELERLQSRIAELETSLRQQKTDNQSLLIKDYALESLLNAVAFADLEGKLTYINKAFLEMWGYEGADAVLGRQASEFVNDPDEAHAIIETLRRLGFWSGDLMVQRRDRSLFHVQLSAHLVRDPGGRPLCLMGTFVDITERKYMIERLVESEHRYSDLFENANDAIFILDAAQRFIDLNKKAEVLTGYLREELIARSVFDFLPPEQKSRSDQEFMKLRNEGGYENFVGKMRRKDGSWVDVEVNSSAIVEDGEVVGSRDVVRDITSRLETQKKLKTLNHAIRHSINGVAFSDAEGKLVFANKAALKMWGYDDESEILGRSPIEFSESVEETLEIIREVHENGGATGELVAKRKDGSLFDVLFAASLIREHGGTPMGIMSSFLDVTERKRAERELRIKDEAIRKSTNGISFTDAEGKIVYANDTFLKMWGYDDEREVIGRSPHELSATEEEGRGVIEEVMKKGSYLGEVSAKRRDGSIFDIHLSATVLRDEHDAPLVLMASFIDITDRKKAERELRRSHELLEQRVQERTAELQEANISLSHEMAHRIEAERQARQSEELFRTAFQTSPDAMAISSIQEAVYKDVNEAFTDITGFEREEVIGRSAVKLHLWFNPIDRDVLIDQLKENGSVKDYEIKVRKKDGSLLIGLMSAKFIDIQTESYLLTVLKDITDRKRTEEKLKEYSVQLEQKNKELEHALELAHAADRIKNEFLANVSHELRTPIHGILGLSELLLQSPLEEEQKEYADLVFRSASALLSVIDEILDYAMLADKRIALHDRPFDLRDLLRELRELFAVPAKDKGISLMVDVAPGVPTELYGDPPRLRQVLMSLMGNAIKFTKEGRVEVKVRKVSASDKELRLRFHVIDTGIGVPEELRSVIFRGFSQADGAFSRSYEGLGLGLTIASELVSLMGSTLELQSEPGKGSDFHFAVSVAPVYQNMEEAMSDAVDKGVFKKILLVDDNPVDQRIASYLLRKAGYVVRPVGSGTEALKAYHEGIYDLIILDIMMPDMDGYQVARAIREAEEGLGTRVPIVALTARVLDEDRKRSLEAGMDVHLAKPINEADLLTALHEVI